LLHVAAVGCVVAFAATVVLEHALAPELVPTRHMISEYANARAGGLMVFGFLAWAASLAITAVLVGRDRSRRGASVAHAVLIACLVIATLGLLVTACFHTQTVAGVLPSGTQRSASGRLHDLGSGMAMLALFGAVVASAQVIGTRHALGRWLLVLLAIAVVTDATLLAVGSDVAGVRQRLLVAAACVWQVVLLLALQDRNRVSVASSSADATGPLRSMSR
jgi:hypothetical protein